MAVVGAGPVGLSLVLGLARRGVRSVLVEQAPTTSERSKAPAVHVRTREAFRRWGVEDALLRAGTLLREVRAVDVARGRPLFEADLGILDDEADRPGILILEQGSTEDVLLAAVEGSRRCDVRFATEAVGVEQDVDGVIVRCRCRGESQRIRARFTVGCDGAGSFVRDALGWELRGRTYALRPVLADVHIDDDRDALPWPRVWDGGGGLTFAVRLRPGRWRIVALRLDDGPDEVDEADLEPAVIQLLGPGAFDVEWGSRFRIHRRAVDRFRQGRILLAGDAAHLHSPAGGQGMNGGIQDAENLAWKLARSLRGGDVERLLDSYDIERRGVVVEDVSRFTDLLTRVFIQAPRPVRRLAFAAARTVLRVPGTRRRALRQLAMLDLRTPASPLLDASARGAGTRLPNPLLRRPPAPPIRLHDLLPPGAALLAVGVAPHRAGEVPLVDRVVPIPIAADRSGGLRRLLGGARGWILVRPDGVVAFARREGEEEALAATARRALGG